MRQKHRHAEPDGGHASMESRDVFKTFWPAVVGCRTQTHTHGKCFHLVCWRKTYELSCLSPSHCRCLYCVHLLSDPHTFALQRDVPAAKCEIRWCEVLLFLCYQHPENTGSDVFYKKVHSKQPMPHEHIFKKKKVSGRQGWHWQLHGFQEDQPGSPEFFQGHSKPQEHKMHCNKTAGFRF